MSTQLKPQVIVVGTDYSPYAEKALRVAYEHARRSAPAELHVAHVSLSMGPEAVAPVLAPLSGFAAPIPVRSLDDQKAQLIQYLDSLIPSLPGIQSANVRIIAHVLLDKPAVALTQLASQLDAALIVVGSHGRRGVERWLLGSVAEGVARQAPCPVLIVPPERQALTPSIAPPCPLCVEAREASAGAEMWCEQHRARHGRRHTYHQGDRISAGTNLPLVMR